MNDKTEGRLVRLYVNHNGNLDLCLRFYQINFFDMTLKEYDTPPTDDESSPAQWLGYMQLEDCTPCLSYTEYLVGKKRKLYGFKINLYLIETKDKLRSLVFYCRSKSEYIYWFEIFQFFFFKKSLILSSSDQVNSVSFESYKEHLGVKLHHQQLSIAYYLSMYFRSYSKSFSDLRTIANYDFELIKYCNLYLPYNNKFNTMANIEKSNKQVNRYSDQVKQHFRRLILGENRSGQILKNYGSFFIMPYELRYLRSKSFDCINYSRDSSKSIIGNNDDFLCLDKSRAKDQTLVHFNYSKMGMKYLMSKEEIYAIYYRKNWNKDVQLIQSFIVRNNVIKTLTQRFRISLSHVSEELNEYLKKNRKSNAKRINHSISSRIESQQPESQTQPQTQNYSYIRFTKSNNQSDNGLGLANEELLRLNSHLQEPQVNLISGSSKKQHIRTRSAIEGKGQASSKSEIYENKQESNEMTQVNISEIRKKEININKGSKFKPYVSKIVSNYKEQRSVSPSYGNISIIAQKYTKMDNIDDWKKLI